MSNPYESPESEPAPMMELAASSQQMVRVTQIITVALAMGALGFLMFCLVMKKAAIDFATDNLLSWSMIAFAAVHVGLHFVMPSIVARKAMDRIDSESFVNSDNETRFQRLFGVFQTQQIIAMALLEAAAFANITAYFSFSPFVGNLIVAVVLIAMILANFPTAYSVRNWIETRSRDIVARST